MIFNSSHLPLHRHEETVIWIDKLVEHATLCIDGDIQGSLSVQFFNEWSAHARVLAECRQKMELEQVIAPIRPDSDTTASLNVLNDAHEWLENLVRDLKLITLGYEPREPLSRARLADFSERYRGGINGCRRYWDIHGHRDALHGGQPLAT